jgi:hypothetical protein
MGGSPMSAVFLWQAGSWLFMCSLTFVCFQEEQDGLFSRVFGGVLHSIHSHTKE